MLDIISGVNKRLILELPPRHGKSEIASKHFPVSYLGKHPDRQIILTSATDDLATDFSSAARDITEEFGPSVFGIHLRSDKRAGYRWELEEGGGVRAAGVGGAIMGRGCSLLIIDDYFKNVEEALSETYRKKVHQWYHSTSTTRLTPDGAIIIIATRWHPKDLIGQVLEEAKETGEQWRRICLPAINEQGEALWPERFGIDLLQTKRTSYFASGYPWMWEALYQQNPPGVLDAEFDPKWFTDDVIWASWPELSNIRMVVTTLDPSLGKTDKSDYSAFITAALTEDGTIHVDANIDRRHPNKIVDDGIDIWLQHNPIAFAVESVGFQEVLNILFEERSRLRGGIMMPLHMMSHGKNSKENRIRRLVPYLAKGQIKVRRSHGGALLVEQLKTFPANKHDDGPDALEMAIRLLIYMMRGGSGVNNDPIFDNVFS